MNVSHCKTVLRQLITFCVPWLSSALLPHPLQNWATTPPGCYGSGNRYRLYWCLRAGGASFPCWQVTTIPHLSIVSWGGWVKLPVWYSLDIPQIMPVMSALVFSVMIGLAAAHADESKDDYTKITGLIQITCWNRDKSHWSPVLPIFICPHSVHCLWKYNHQNSFYGIY